MPDRLPIEVRLDPTAPPSNLVEVLAALILERARQVVAARAAAAPSESPRKYHEPSAGTARGGER
jgi:hypothetical protein